MAPTTITNRLSLTFLAPMNLKSSHLTKPSSVCFSNLGSSIAPRLAVASSLNKHLFAHGLLARTNPRRVRASSCKDGGGEEEEKRLIATWQYQLFSVVKLLIDWFFRLCMSLVFLLFATLWVMMIANK